jgi:hypothetical protein
MIENLIQATRHVHEYKDCDLIVVSSTGDIILNRDVDEACKVFEDEGKTAFIVKGEKKPIKKVKNVQS